MIDKKTFEEEWVNKIHHGNCIDLLKELPDECIDVVVTSPPYNLRNSLSTELNKENRSKQPKIENKKQKENSNEWANKLKLLNEGYDNYNDCLPHDVYVKQQRELLTQLMRLIKKDGAIFYNHKWRVLDGILQTRSDIVQGFPVRQIIIWDRFTGITRTNRFFMPVYEVVYLITKEDFKLISDEAINYTDIWRLSIDGQNPHPAPFPTSFVHKCISSCVAKGSKKIILDPYMGSGTTAVVAESYGCRYIGMDVSEKYIEMANKRIEKNRVFDELKLLDKEDKKAREYRYYDNKQKSLNVKKLSF